MLIYTVAILVDIIVTVNRRVVRTVLICKVQLLLFFMGFNVNFGTRVIWLICCCFQNAQLQSRNNLYHNVRNYNRDLLNTFTSYGFQATSVDLKEWCTVHQS